MRRYRQDQGPASLCGCNWHCAPAGPRGGRHGLPRSPSARPSPAGSPIPSRDCHRQGDPGPAGGRYAPLWPDRYRARECRTRYRRRRSRIRHAGRGYHRPVFRPAIAGARCGISGVRPPDQAQKRLMQQGFAAVRCRRGLRCSIRAEADRHPREHRRPSRCRCRYCRRCAGGSRSSPARRRRAMRRPAGAGSRRRPGRPRCCRLSARPVRQGKSRAGRHHCPQGHLRQRMPTRGCRCGPAGE